MSNLIAADSKPTMNYRVIAGTNPKDRTKTILHPLIVNKETYDTARCLKFAMDNGYITAGQFYSNFGDICFSGIIFPTQDSQITEFNFGFFDYASILNCKFHQKVPLVYIKMITVTRA